MGASVRSAKETLSSGETVEIRLSKTAFGTAGDATAARQWADFFGSLLHGPEISLLQIYLLTPREISSICGQNALAVTVSPSPPAVTA